MIGATELEGTDQLEILTLEEGLCAGNLVKRSTGKDRRDLRNTTKQVRSLFDQGNRDVVHRSANPIPDADRRVEGPSRYVEQISMAKGEILEREKGFEPSTLALARRCSTTELFPLEGSL